MPRGQAKRIEVKEGNVIVPIYEFTDGRYCVDMMLGKTRKRITRASLDAAKIEARKLIAQASAGKSHEILPTVAELEDYRLAKEKIAGFGVSLLRAVEEWVSLKAATAQLVPKTVPEVVSEFLGSKQVEGISQRHFEDRRSRLNRFASEFSGQISSVTPRNIETWLNGLGISSRTKNNYRSALQQLFRFAQSRRHLPRNERLAIEEIAELRIKEGSIEIYISEELKTLLAHAPSNLLSFFALGAFAGLRTQEIVRLEWPDIRFEQRVIEVGAAKAKTASRRLVPILPVLRDWLLPLQKSSGHVIEFRSYTPFDRARLRFCKTGIVVNGEVVPFAWKSNALRHSYASYRLAEIKDAARVALEMGNSPSMLFRNYRELVTEQQATEWFSLTRSAVRPSEAVLVAVA